MCTAQRPRGRERCAVDWRRTGPGDATASRAAPYGRAMFRKQAFCPPPESPDPGLPEAVRPTGPPVRKGESSTPPLFEGPRRAGAHCGAPDACRLRRCDHEVSAFLSAHTGIPTEHSRPALRGWCQAERWDVVTPLEAAPCLFDRSDPNLLQPPISGRLRPLRDHSRPDLDGFVTIRDRPKRPRPSISRLRRVDKSAFGFLVRE